MAFVFHVEFGMNDTPLTQALEQGNFATAERLILDCPHASYLDDGFYQRIPLYICLCGVDESHQKVISRNFYLARLLIEHGANVNHRVPVINFGSEFISPGKSCLELLVDLYIDLSRYPTSEHPEATCSPQSRVWNPLTELVVGLNRQYLTNVDDVKEDVQNLIFNIIRHGGDPNVVDENRANPLHRLSMYSHDVALLELLCDNGANVDMLDTSGNTPLLSLCHVASLQTDNSYNVSPESDSDLPEKTGENERPSLKVKADFLQFLLNAKETDVNHQNSAGQTALFHCILREDVTSARALLDAGADPSLQACVWVSRRKKRKLSALFASLMSIPVQRSLFHFGPNQLLTHNALPIAGLVDAGYFSTREVIRELSTLIQEDFPEFTHLCPNADSLLHLMFGYKSASLKQLAARKVFQCSLIESTACLHNILPVSSIQDNFHAEELLSDPSKFEEYITLVLNCTVLRRLTELLQLPKSVLVHLESQLLFLRMSLKFCQLQALRPANSSAVCSIFDEMTSDTGGGGSSGEEDTSNSEDDSGEDSSENDVEGDSDLEYW